MEVSGSQGGGERDRERRAGSAPSHANGKLSPECAFPATEKAFTVEDLTFRNM